MDIASRHFGVCVILTKPSGGNYRYYYTKSIIPYMSYCNTYIQLINSDTLFDRQTIQDALFEKSQKEMAVVLKVRIVSQTHFGFTNMLGVVSRTNFQN